MSSFLKWLGKRVLIGLGVVVILLALAVGAFRVMIAQIPSYQSELQAWVANELGLNIEFQRLDARLGLNGPELTFEDASIGLRDTDRAFLVADRAFVALDPWQLIFAARGVPARLTLDGVSVTLERTLEGEFRLEGMAPDAASQIDLAGLVPQTVELVVLNSQLLYRDLAKRRSWQFLDVTIALDRQPGGVTIDSQLQPPAELAERIDFSLDAIIDEATALPTEWRLETDFASLNLDAMAALIPVNDTVDIDGVGDFSFALEWDRAGLAQVASNVALAGVEIGDAEQTGGNVYQNVEFGATWVRESDQSWRLLLEDVNVQRNGESWLADGRSVFALDQDNGEVRSLTLQSDFVRLRDLTPLIMAFPESQLAEQWALFEPRGELNGIDFSLALADDEWDYNLVARFDSLSVKRLADAPGIAGLSGDVRAGARSGTINFDSAQLTIDLPSVFREIVSLEALQGAVVWRQGQDVVRVVSDDLHFDLVESAVETSFELSFPLDGSLPHVDVEASATTVDLIAVKRQLLPVHVMLPRAVAWIDKGIQSGYASDIELSVYGPLAAFPFDAGEGEFRVTADIADVVVDYIDGWPRAEELTGRVEFLNAGFVGAGSGRTLNNRSSNLAVSIADLRDAVLTYASTTRGPLVDVVDFLHSAPLIAGHLGVGFERLEAHAGIGLVDINLSLPLLDRAAFELDGTVTLVDGEISVAGFGPRATEVGGVLEVTGDSVVGSAVDAVFLGGPVVASVAKAGQEGYRTVLNVAGETTAEAVLQSFSLPFQDLFGGQTMWQGQLLLPTRTETGNEPVRIEFQSNLSGVALRFPEPLAKPPGEASNLQLDFQFTSADQLEIDGNLGATRRFALDYGIDSDRLQFRRGTVAFGGAEPLLEDSEGIVVSGRLPQLDLNDWLALAKTTSIERARPLFLGADLEVAEFRAFGQHLGSTHLAVEREDDGWDVEIESEAIAGRVQIPLDLSTRAQIIADMERVHLAAGGNAEITKTDPQTLPGLRLQAKEFGFGQRQLGAVEAEVVADPLGLRMVSVTSQGESFNIEASGSWLEGAGGSTTRVAATINSNDVAKTLSELGMDLVIEGEMADLSASVYWSGPPTGSWLDHLNGDVGLRVETGSLVEIDPGAGRVVGLMSIAALPRRLALDFRDVFNKGFVFDEITGDFNIIDGNAYTNNLKMAGPGAEIGLVGRTGLRERDYRQQAVVTAEPSNMLPTVGGILGGPGVGAALLIFTRLFKEPLRGIGRASYCVTGPWAQPEVERISGNESEQAELCAELPPSMIGVTDD